MQSILDKKEFVYTYWFIDFICKSPRCNSSLTNILFYDDIMVWFKNKQTGTALIFFTTYSQNEMLYMIRQNWN